MEHSMRFAYANLARTRKKVAEYETVLRSIARCETIARPIPSVRVYFETDEQVAAFIALRERARVARRQPRKAKR